MKSTRELDPWYVTGFVEGEGTFTYSRGGRGGLGLYFAVKLSSVDSALLQRLQAYFGGIGRLYQVRARRPGKNSGDTLKAVYYRVTRRLDLLRVVDHFDQYPLAGRKHESYRIWREMVMLKQDFRRVDLNALNSLAARLSAACVRVPLDRICR